MQLERTRLDPYLTRPLPGTRWDQVDAWLTAISAFLTSRYGNRITVALEPLFVGYTADAVQRRLDKPQQLVDSQQVGPASIRWNPASTTGGWFLPAELADMDRACGRGSTSTVRMQAPAPIVASNTVAGLEDV